MSRFLDWLDDRTGLPTFARDALRHQIPGGARWRHAWGTAVLFAFAMQAVSGVALWACYSPGAQSAWESVFHLQFDLHGGWLLRGWHHFNAEALTILLVIHLLQMAVYGACRAPREMIFWLALVLLLVVVGESVTGWLLPWDQRGFWAAKVPVNIIAATPLIGPWLRNLLVGGPDFGNATLTRFLALHAGVLPAAIIFLIAAQAFALRRHGLAPKTTHARAFAAWWPDQALRDAAACFAVAATVTFLAVRHHGVELGPPADPSQNYSAARPEWFFLFLYQWLKYFPGGSEVIGAMVIPGVFLLAVFLMPFTARRRWGQVFNVSLLAAALAGAALLTWRAVATDRVDPTFIAAKNQAAAEAVRVKILVRAQGVPVGGALQLLRRDPWTQGPRLFAQRCAACHRYDGHNGLGAPVADAPSASDLKGFGSREWLATLLDPAQVDGLRRFGGTAFKDGKMIRFVKQKLSQFPPEQKAAIPKVIAAVSAEAHLPSQGKIDAAGTNEIAAGVEWFNGGMRCGECHAFHSSLADATAPDLTGWGSREWLISFIGNPKQDRFYGNDNDRMPAFLDQKILDADSIALLADWLRAQ